MKQPVGVLLACILFCRAAAPAAQQPSPQAAAQVAPATISAAEAIVDALARGDFAGVFAKFNATMKSALPVEKLTASWDAMQGQAGAFRRRHPARASVQGAYSIVVIPSDFERARLDLAVSFDKAGEVAGFTARPSAEPPAAYTAPAYAPAGSSTERDVVVGEWALPGTLTLPTGAGPFPALVLVHGSGPHDRDQSFGPNRIFKDLALGLAARGVAVLRYEKRTKLHPTKAAALPGFTVKEESIDDTLAAVALLRKDSSIDARRIYVVGHSLGGLLAPRIAAADPNLAGIVVMAGPVRPVALAIVEQLQYLAESDGVVTDAEKKALDDAKTAMAQVSKLTDADRTSMTMIGGAPASYWYDLQNYAPAASAAKLTLPILILQGGRDYQVTAAGDFEQWKTTLAGKSNVTFKLYPSLNHFFIAGEGKSLPGEYFRPGHVAQEVIDDIAAWIKR